MLEHITKNKRLRILYSLLALALVVGLGWVTGPSDVKVPSGPVAAPQMNRPGGEGTLPQSGSAPSDASVPGRVTVIHSLKNDVSPPLSEMKPLPPTGAREGELEGPENPVVIARSGGNDKQGRDPVLQDWFTHPAGDNIPSPNIPSPVQNFAGISFTGAEPPDTNGDVGPNHYVQTVNTSYQVWNKSGGSVFGPISINTLWSGFGGFCQSNNNGDPIVLHDALADRWLISQIAIPGGGSGYHQCIAVSTSSSPTGSFNRYDFLISATLLNDYPKFGVWPDAYYMTVNQFNGGSFSSVGAVAFDRARMLAGLSATMQKFELVNHFGMLPSDLEGSTVPPAGAPNYFVTWNGPFANTLRLYRFHVDWVTPANSTFTGSFSMGTAAFDSVICGASRGECIPQPGTGVLLEDLTSFTMYRLAYRNFGSYEALVANHTVDATGGGRAGVRWYEIRNPNGSPFIQQQGTYSPDTDHRWTGSIAIDRVGNMGLSYNVSSGTTFPSIRYTGRLITDTLGTMPQGEATLIAGGAAHTISNRWGDYSSISVDPTDDCTFWITNEYTPSGVNNWRTRIGSFTFPSCSSAPTNTPTATRTATRTPTSVFTLTPTRTPTPTLTPVLNAFAYFSPSGPMTVTLGARVDLDLVVSSGIHNVTAQQSYLTFTNSILQNVNATMGGCVLTNTFTTDTAIFDAALQNEICNGPGSCIFRGVPTDPGTIGFASGALGNPPFNGPDFSVAQLALCTYAVGTATLHWQFAPPDPPVRDTQITDENSETVSNRSLYSDYTIYVVAPSPTSTPTNTPVPSGFLVGHVTWQGPPAQPNTRQQQPITLTLKSGTTEVNYPSTTTDASGFFTVSVGSLTPGSYNWRVKGVKQLANSGALALAGAPTTQAEMGTMRAGDCNNDNLVNSVDFTILRNTFGKALGDPGYDARADFNYDDLVNSTDFTLLRNNFGIGGAPPIKPGK